MKKTINESWEHDFKEFLDTETVEPPRDLSIKIQSAVSKELNPQAWLVFIKLLAATSISGVLSLALCPQFGFGNNFWLMRFFMSFGLHICSIACGAIFIGLGIIAASFILRPEELRVLKKTRLLQVILLSQMSLGAFICAGAEVFLTLAFFWSLGAVVGGLLTLEVSYRIRFSELHAAAS